MYFNVIDGVWGETYYRGTKAYLDQCRPICVYVTCMGLSANLYYLVTMTAADCVIINISLG